MIFTGELGGSYAAPLLPAVLAVFNPAIALNAEAIASTGDCGAEGALEPPPLTGPGKCNASTGSELSGSFGERSARRSVVLRSAITSKSACFGVTSSVTVVEFASCGDGVAELY